MNIDVLMHAALARLGPVTVSWERPPERPSGPKCFSAKVEDGDHEWAVHNPTWDGLWQAFILEAVARR